MFPDPRLIFDLVDLLGVLANGVLGGTVARTMKFDPVGFVALAIVSGLGGGAVRDVLLQAGPVAALVNPAYVMAALLGAFISFLLPMRGKWVMRALSVADALALGCWAATGTGKALTHDIFWVPAILLGVVTAVGGGVVRDLLVGRVPAVFGGNTLYATCAVVGAVLMAACSAVGHSTLGMASSIVVCTIMCLLARRRGWYLPMPLESARMALRTRLRNR